MDAIRPHHTPDVDYSDQAGKKGNVTDNATDFPEAIAAFEAIEASDESIDCAGQEGDGHQNNSPTILTEEEIKAKNARIKQLKDRSLCDPLDRVSDFAASFFIIAMEGTHASATELANAMHDAFSNPLESEKTAIIESFEIALKKEMLAFIKTIFIDDAYQPAASKAIDNYIRELVSRRDCVRLGAASAEFLLASHLGDEKHAEAVQGDIAALQQGSYQSQIEMREALSIADSSCGVVDMLDKFEMMLRSNCGELATLDAELRHLSVMADRWEDFVQKYAPWTLKKGADGVIKAR
ncbi:hypothetical protein JHU04_001146 [Brenneria sp. 4F2]|nr:hypothetical protein [Brenneria bubanii]